LRHPGRPGTGAGRRGPAQPRRNDRCGRAGGRAQRTGRVGGRLRQAAGRRGGSARIRRGAEHGVSVSAEPRAAAGTTTRILVADPIAPDGVDLLREAGEVDVATGLDAAALAERIAEYDALVVRSETKVTAALLDRAKRLRVV